MSGAKKAVITDTKPTEIDALASMLVQDLTAYFQQAMPATAIVLGVVVDTDTGPPVSLTVNIQGEEIPNVRYIGAAPSINDIVVITRNNTNYISLGVLS